MRATPRVSGAHEFSLPSDGVLPSLSHMALGLEVQILEVVGQRVQSRLEFRRALSQEVGHEFLARWWINGKPWRGRFLESRCKEQERLTRARAVRRVELELEFDAQVLGAKPGDWIEFQLLHAPDGVQRFGQEVLQKAQDVRATGQCFPVVSRPVGFLYSGALGDRIDD